LSESPSPGFARNNFDFLRFFFASLVILSHSFPLGSGTEDGEPLLRFTNGQLTMGALAVDCFFVISGFLISQSWCNRPSVPVFLEKRVRRIYPGFIAATLLGAFVITPLFSAQGTALIDLEFVARYVANTLRLLAISPGPAFESNPAAGTLNGSLWSISYEFWCYIGVMGCGLLGLLNRPRWLAAGLLGAIATSFVFTRFHLTPSGWWIGAVFGYPPFWARLLPYFLVGMVVYACRDRLRFGHVGAVASAVLFVVAAGVPNGMIFLLPFIAACAIFWFAYLPIPRLHGFAKHGDLSYGIYLYAFPIQQLIVHAYGGPMNPYLLFVCAWAASIVVSAASWRFIERRFVKPAARPLRTDDRLTA
jgi:peptidoglycan/LPS O-acetylase OafA/YrhL